MSAQIGTPLPDPPRRAVRRTRRGDQKSELIRSTATELFLRHGYDGVSVDEIVRVVGGSKTNVYNHFQNKEGLFVAIVNGLLDDLLASVRSIDISNLGVKEGLRSLGLALVGVLLQKRHLAFQRLVIAESARFPALGRAWFASGPEASRALIAKLVGREQRAGRLRVSDPHLSATLFHDMITFDFLHRAMIGDGPGDDEIRERIDTAIEILMHGLARKEAVVVGPQSAGGRADKVRQKRSR